MKFDGNRIISLDNQVNPEPSLVPVPEFSLMLSASKGGGKTSVLLNMLLNKNILGQKFNQIHIISPTNKLDVKWNILKENKVLTPNLKLIAEYQKVKKVSIADYGENEKPEYNQELTDLNFTEDVSIELIQNIITQQKMIIKKFGKETADRVLLIYDDTVAETKFWNSPKVRQLMFNSRHYKVSLIITTQAYHSIPKPLRLNMSLMLLYYTANATELKTIYEENSSNLTFTEFQFMFNEVCTSRAFNFLTINYQNQIKFRYIYCLERFIEN